MIHLHDDDRGAYDLDYTAGEYGLIHYADPDRTPSAVVLMSVDVAVTMAQGRARVKMRCYRMRAMNRRDFVRLLGAAPLIPALQVRSGLPPLKVVSSYAAAASPGVPGISRLVALGCHHPVVSSRRCSRI